MALTIGETLQGRYRIDGLLGQGGMGAVYRAWDNRLGITVALKEMTPQPGLDPHLLTQLRKQFRQEANVLARLDHPHLVRVIDFFEGESNGYLVMDFVEGESLAERIGREGALEEEQVLAWAEDLLDALAYCHDQGVLHRDVKPHNMIIRDDGRAVLVDFGLVKLWDPDDPHTKTAMRGMGTPEYAPPEQYDVVAGHTDPRSDVYSVGATLYHALTGETPPSATQRMVNPASLKSPSVLSAGLTAETERAVLMALEPQPEHRFQSAGEMAAVLSGEKPFPARSASAQMGPTGTTMLPGATAPARGRGRLVWAGLGLAVLAALGWWLTRPGSPLGVALVTPTLVADATAVPTSVPPTATLAPTPSPTPTPTPIPLAWARFTSGQPLARETGQSFARDIVTAIVIDPSDPDVWYAGTKNAGIYKSINGGVSWQPVHNGLGRSRVETLIIDPDEPRILYAGTLMGGVYKTVDGGEHWQAVNQGIRVDDSWQETSDIVMDPQDSQHLFYTNGWGLYESEDGAESWDDLPSWWPSGVGRCGILQRVRFSPLDSQTLLMLVGEPGGDCGGVYRSTDGGATWTLTGLATGGSYWSDLWIDNVTGDYVYAYAASDGASYWSSDGGNTWQEGPSRQCNEMVFHPEDGATAYCLQGGDVKRTTNGGQSWQQLGSVETQDTASIILAPHDPNTILAGGAGLFVSTDSGYAWEERSSGLGAARLELRKDPFERSMLYVENAVSGGSSSQLYRSSDGGQAWELVYDQGSGLAFDADGETLYRISRSPDLDRAAIMISHNGGATWERAYLPSSVEYIHRVAANPMVSGKVYVSVVPVDHEDRRTYYSTDGGATWEKATGSADPGIPLSIEPTQGSVAYGIAGIGGVCKSFDAGESWQDCQSSAGGWSPNSDSAMIIDPRDSERFFLAKQGGGVVLSEDGCDSWVYRNSGLGSLFVNTLALDPQNPDTVYAGTDSGAYISFDSGEYWAPLNEGLLGGLVIYSIVVNPQGDVYTATPLGIFRLESR